MNIAAPITPWRRRLAEGYRTITVTPMNPTIGAEISGLDLSRPIADETAAELRRALNEHLAIFLRDQPLNHEAHRQLAAVFGEAHVAPSTEAWRVPGYPEITTIHADATSTYVAGEDWHSDMSCDPAPPMGSVLYLHTLPSLGGDTVFASMYAAYDALSEAMKATIGGLNAVHDAAIAFGDKVARELQLPCSTHPMVRTHPATGRKALYVNRGYTTHIEGIPRAESDALLRFLYAHVANPMFQCRFTWSPHAIAIWDNRCGQHMAIWDYFPETRSGFRIQIKGDRPV